MHAQALDRLLALLNSGAGTAVYNVDSSLAEVEDLLSYCNDILCTGTLPLMPADQPMLHAHAASTKCCTQGNLLAMKHD